MSTPKQVIVPVADLPVVNLPEVPWVADPLVQPSYVGWNTPRGYLPPYAPLIDYPSITSVQGLCATVAVGSCRSLGCLNGVAFAVDPFVVDSNTRLALDAGSPAFVNGVNLYNECVRAVAGGWGPGPNVFI
jgi:hypothetical protein